MEYKGDIGGDQLPASNPRSAYCSGGIHVLMVRREPSLCPQDSPQTRCSKTRAERLLSLETVERP